MLAYFYFFLIENHSQMKFVHHFSSQKSMAQMMMDIFILQEVIWSTQIFPRGEDSS